MIAIDRDDLVRTLGELVRINSVNPSLVPGAPGEAEIAQYVAARMREAGLEVEQHEPQPGRVSTVGRLPGAGSGKSLMLNAHVDTVGVEEMREPFSAEIRDGRLYGRGSYDMKGAAAACMAAAFALKHAGVTLAGDLLVALVADEEHASIGTANLITKYKVDGAIVTEPSQLEICLAHKGFIWLEVETLGRAAHGSQHHLGVDANLRMGRFLAELDALEQELRARPPHPLVGPPSLHAATIAGGSGLSTYAENCTLGIERRTVPGETADQVLEEINGIVTRLSAEDETFHSAVRTTLVREPFEVTPDAAIVRALEKGATAVLGETPAHRGENPWMDSALLSAAGVETVVFGPAGEGAHAAKEWVDLDSVAKLAQILTETALVYCA